MAKTLDEIREYHRKYAIKWRKEHPEKDTATLRRYRQRHREKINEYNRTRLAKKKESDPQIVRFYRLKAQYGLSREDYAAMISEQNNSCAICEELFISTPFVDHEHKTKKVRGLLCSHCNRALGAVKDSPSLAIKAAQYLIRKSFE